MIIQIMIRMFRIFNMRKIRITETDTSLIKIQYLESCCPPVLYIVKFINRSMKAFHIKSDTVVELDPIYFSALLAIQYSKRRRRIR